MLLMLMETVLFTTKSARVQQVIRQGLLPKKWASAWMELRKGKPRGNPHASYQKRVINKSIEFETNLRRTKLSIAEDAVKELEVICPTSLMRMQEFWHCGCIVLSWPMACHHSVCPR